MDARTVMVVGSMIVTAVLTMAYFLNSSSRRYITNNPNAAKDDFNVYQDSTCPICLEPMNVDNALSCALLNCGHCLHRSCLRDMDNSRNANITNKCPICRTPIRST
ncbi:uncharacterized protein LOC129905704 [Episyrphus balteatus]|uniref:uncharacterized protein LOC129905704 n=1 Tax=Episyrphus balteatus TaxID=286459 RepID=UPI002486A34F|nr:uncharacterized protein LOC129905704 [Episyrphus balteatus]